MTKIKNLSKNFGVFKSGIWITLALAIRSLLFFVSTLVVFRFHSSSQSIEFFQLILFQSIIISFCSAASQNQLIKKYDDENKPIQILSGYLNVAVLAGLLSILYILYLDRSDYDQTFMIIAATGGCFAAAASALMAITRRDFGDRKAFMLAAVSCIPSIGLIVTIGTKDIALVYTAILISQILNFIAQAVVVRTMLYKAVFQGFLRLQSIFSPVSSDILLRGISNIIIIAGIFFWREEWVSNISEDFSSLVLFLFRVGDISLQVLVMMLVRFSIFDAVMRSYRKQYISVYFLVTVILFATLYFIGSGANYAIWTVLIIHLLFELHRLSMAITYNYQASQPRGSTYFLYQVIPISVAIGISFLLLSYEMSFGIYVFMGVISTLSFAMSARNFWSQID